MKKSLLLIFSFIPLLISCSNESKSVKQLYLCCKYKLDYAAINDSYVLDEEPAYFKQIKGVRDITTLFDKSHCFCTLNTKFIDDKPFGFGNIELFANSTQYEAAFNYTCIYNKVYGGTLYNETTSGDNFLGKGICRGHYRSLRLEAFLPEISEKNLLLEFSVSEILEEPNGFEHSF